MAVVLHLANLQGDDRPAGLFIFGLQVEDLQGLPLAYRLLDDPDLLIPGEQPFGLGILKAGQKLHYLPIEQQMALLQGLFQDDPSRLRQRDRATYICPWAKVPRPTSITAFSKVFPGSCES